MSSQPLPVCELLVPILLNLIKTLVYALLPLLDLLSGLLEFFLAFHDPMGIGVKFVPSITRV